MCGIAGIYRRTDKPITELNRLADNLLIAIEHRGRDASGFLAMMDTGRVQIEKRTDRAAVFVRDRKRIAKHARTVLLHTRYATKGAADDPRNAHPVINGSCAAVHNGTIYNDDEVFRAFGLKRHAEVDSEVIPAIVNYAGWDQAAAALNMLEGGAATAIVNSEHPRELILARLRSFPLAIAVTDDLILWASEVSAIATAYRMTYGWDLRRDRFDTLGEWTMLRVNGTIATSRIREPKKWSGWSAPTKPATTKPAPSKVGRASRPPAKPKPKLAKKKKGRRPASTPELPLYHETREQWTLDAVTDLMRWSGMTRDEAHEAVYGTSFPDDWEWENDSLVGGSDGR